MIGCSGMRKSNDFFPSPVSLPNVYIAAFLGNPSGRLEMETEQWIIVGILFVVVVVGAALLARQSALTGYVVEDRCARCTTARPACVLGLDGRAVTVESRCLAECEGLAVLAKVACEELPPISE